MFRIDMLPADHGDCLWIEYGEKKSPFRILIDGGTFHSYPALRQRIEALPPRQRRFELFVVTHIDTDHIGGSLELLRDREALQIGFRDIWFNGWQQIIPSGLGSRDGERLTDHLREGVKAGQFSWNRPFGGKAVVVHEGSGKLSVSKLRGGMKLTVLSPTRQQLVKLRAVWQRVITEANLKPGQVMDEKRRTFRRDILGTSRIEVDKLAESKFTSDNKAANGSSIALLAEYDGKSCLLTGDAYATTLADSLLRLMAERGIEGRIPLNAIKLSHHGSKKNLSNKLLDIVKCRRYLFSTNGDSFKHPNLESVARVIKHGGTRPQLLFNYRTRFNKMWDDRHLIDEFEYRVKYGSDRKPGFLRVEL